MFSVSKLVCVTSCAFFFWVPTAYACVVVCWKLFTCDGHEFTMSNERRASAAPFHTEHSGAHMLHKNKLNSAACDDRACWAICAVAAVAAAVDCHCTWILLSLGTQSTQICRHSHFDGDNERDERLLLQIQSWKWCGARCTLHGCTERRSNLCSTLPMRRQKNDRIIF